MSMQIRTAERRKAKMRVGITSPSGGGKTYSALLLARGLASGWGKVGLVDTENGSGELYSQLGPYQVITLEAPFTPDRYIEAIDLFEKSGVEVIILDSATHEWDGVGGCLEIVDKLTTASRSKNAYSEGWRVITPLHQRFIARILSAKCHIVTTTRRKQDYDMSKDSSGKTTITKVGLKEVQRDGFEYELTINFELDMGHNATASKDRTGMFDGKLPFVITEATGEQIKSWCESGADLLPEAATVAPAAQAATAAPRVNGSAVQPPQRKAVAPAAPATDGAISDPQRRRLFAIASKAGWKPDGLKLYLKRAIGTEHTSEIHRDNYEAIVAELEKGPDPFCPHGSVDGAECAACEAVAREFDGPAVAAADSPEAQAQAFVEAMDAPLEDDNALDAELAAQEATQQPEPAKPAAVASSRQVGPNRVLAVKPVPMKTATRNGMAVGFEVAIDTGEVLRVVDPAVAGTLNKAREQKLLVVLTLTNGVVASCILPS